MLVCNTAPSCLHYKDGCQVEFPFPKTSDQGDVLFDTPFELDHVPVACPHHGSPLTFSSEMEVMDIFEKVLVLQCLEDIFDHDSVHKAHRKPLPGHVKSLKRYEDLMAQKESFERWLTSQRTLA